MIKYELLLLNGTNMGSSLREGSVLKKMKFVGIKQVSKAVNLGQVTKVYIGKDVEAHLVKELIENCRVKKIEIVMVETMAELGKMANIETKAAAAAE